MPKVKIKEDTEIEWNGKIKVLKAGVEYNLPEPVAKELGWKPPGRAKPKGKTKE